MYKTETWEGFMKNLYWLLISLMVLLVILMAGTFLAGSAFINDSFHIYFEQALRLFSAGRDSLRYFLFYHLMQVFLWTVFFAFGARRIMKVFVLANAQKPFALPASKALNSIGAAGIVFAVVISLWESIYPLLFDYATWQDFLASWLDVAAVVFLRKTLYLRILKALALKIATAMISTLFLAEREQE